MANEFGLNIQDASLNPATFALPTTLLTAGSKTSAAVDLGADTVKPSSIELELLVPTLNSTMMPAAATGGVVYSIESGVTSTFSDGAARVLVSKTIAGSASGVAQTALRCRLPSDCERYIRARVALPTTATDASAVAATLSLRF
jgi:hypothetical protein